jgi:hypothetical protein
MFGLLVDFSVSPGNYFSLFISHIISDGTSTPALLISTPMPLTINLANWLNTKRLVWVDASDGTIYVGRK